MRALNDLRRFITAKNNDDERSEVRLYLLENAVDLALAFGVSLASFEAAIEKVDDDVELVIRMLDGIRRATKTERALKHESRMKTAQGLADIVGASALWSDGRAEVDVSSMLAYTLTRREDLLVFVADTFTLAVRMAPLFDLHKLRRGDLTGWVDAKRLRVRWRTGGLNFTPQTDPHATRIIVPLARSERIAA